MLTPSHASPELEATGCVENAGSYGRVKHGELSAFVLVRGGEMGALIRAKDWTVHPLDEPAGWPQALKGTIRIALTTRHPIFIFWGPEQFCFYNDAYRASIGSDKHPSMLGVRGTEMWPEIWHIIGPQIDMVMAGGGATWHENDLVPIYRDGVLREVYWTYSYGPIDDPYAPNGVAGVLVICTETTEQVQTSQRLTLEKQSFARLFEQSPSFMALLRGPEHVFELVNPEYLKLVGHRDVIGRTVAAALPETVGQGYIKLLDEVYSTGVPYRAFGAKFARQDGSSGDTVERDVDFVYQPILSDAGEVTGIFVEGIDVTERREADDRRRGAELRLRFLDRLGQAVSRSRDAEEIMTITTQLVGEHMKVSNCAYADMDTDEDGFTIRGDWADEGSPHITGHYSLSDFGQLAVRSLHSGQPLIINDNLKEIAPDEAATFQAIGITATMEAMKVLDSDRMIDLLVTDVGLPHGMNGRQVADAARITRPDLPVLFVTGYAENAVLNHGRLAKGMQILTKPFDMDTFARRVNSLVEDR